MRHEPRSGAKYSSSEDARGEGSWGQTMIMSKKLEGTNLPERRRRYEIQSEKKQLTPRSKKLGTQAEALSTQAMPG